MPCRNPRQLVVDGRAVVGRCHNCEACRSDRIRDWTGRLLAENMYSAGSHCVTLTYGRDFSVQGLVDNPNALILTYHDVQNWLKRLRNGGFPMRYLIAGEYGSQKQRAHFHCLLFWKGKVPPVPEHVTDKNGKRRALRDPFWPHGHTHWGTVDAATARYVVKYLAKDDTDPAKQGLVRMSKKPLLGAVFFDDLARRYVEQGLAPRDRIYRIPGSVDPRTGKLWRYWMNDATVDFLVGSFLAHWRAAHGDRHPPTSELVERFLDRRARPPVLLQRSAYQRVARPAVNPDGSVLEAFGRGAFGFDEKLNVYTGEDRSGAPVFWTFDAEGRPAWSRELVSPSMAAERRELATPAAYAEASGGSSTNRARVRKGFSGKSVPRHDD